MLLSGLQPSPDCLCGKGPKGHTSLWHRNFDPGLAAAAGHATNTTTVPQGGIFGLFGGIEKLVGVPQLEVM